MFIYAMDLEQLMTDEINRSHVFASLNELLLQFDSIIEKYDVFKVEIKGDAVYMLAAGIHDQSYLVDESHRSRSVSPHAPVTTVQLFFFSTISLLGHRSRTRMTTTMMMKKI